MNHLKHALVSEVPKALLKLRVVAKRGWTAAIGHIESAIPRIKSDLTARTAYTSRTVRRYVALSYLRTNRSLYSLRLQITAISGFAVIAGLALLIFISTIIVLPLQGATESYFSEDRFSLLRSFFASTGGALIGATAISFSVVMIAVQLNFARMPHGLFRQLSSDSRLLGAFAITFILAVGVASLSLVPDASWSALALLGAAWSIILILVLFLYGYRRALTLINPLVQLRLIVTSAQKDMRAWDRRARRISPLLEIPDRDRQGNPSTHDMGRVAFFQANPQWTSTSSQAITRSISFARRYAEQRDYEVSDRALTAVLTINASYVRAKGKTFFAHSPIFDIPHATDGFINDTLEQLRQLAQLAIARGDEEQTRQIFAAMAGLVSVYMGIDYASEHVDTKEHAQLAASYLTGAVQGVLPHNMPDVVMEGVRLMGRSAELFLAQSSPIGIVTLAEKIAAISCTGALKESFRPVTLTGMEQLARLTLNLIRTKAHDIHYVAGELTGDVALVVEMFLNVPDAPLINTHGTFLAPYYSLSKAQTLGESLTDLVNTLVNVDVGHENASIVVRNIEKWAEDLPQTEKKLLLLAIEKKIALHIRSSPLDRARQ